jgi:paraquat-inducible protein A
MNARVPIAVDMGLIACDVCSLVMRAPHGAAGERCPRCGNTLHARKPLSVQRTLAWLVVALVLYVPANLLPVMTTTSVLGRFSHTIGGGIVELWSTGSHELALIVFIASVVVPLGKIGSLALLAFTAQRGSSWRQRERAALYRLVDTVGHWSMLDVFVVVLLVGMVQFGVLASVEPAPGLLAFGAVVVATMLAASSFDPRLIWPAQAKVAERAPRG